MEKYSEILTSMQNKYHELTGFNADNASDIGIRFKVLAGELSGIYEELTAIHREAFPQTSTGKFLELHAQTRSITRKGAVKATGTLRFIRDTPAISDIQIPKGIICSTTGDPSYRFITVESAVLSKGENSVDVLSQATEGGTDYNTTPNSVVIMITPANGITSVTNPNPFVGGADEENDESLKSRVLQSYNTISNGTNCAYYYQEVMKHDEITSANVLPKTRGVGTVDVVVTSNGLVPSDEAIKNIRETLSHQKEINVDIQLIAAAAVPTNITVSVYPTLETDFNLLSDELRAVISHYFTAQKVGEPLILAGLGNRIFNTSGVLNYKFALPLTDVYIKPTQVLTLGTLLISRMEV